MTVFHLTVYYDTTCAWCIIGHRVLKQAIELYQRTYPGGRNDEFVFEVRPFYLRPNAPMKGVPLLDAMIEKNGAQATTAIQTRVSRIAQSHGIHISYGSKTGNTRKSHQLVWQTGQVKGSEVQQALVEELLAMHFEKDGDITNEDELAAVAQMVGVDGEQARAWMADDTIGEIVDKMAASAREVDGVQSVPSYFVNGEEVKGAADATTFYETFVSAKDNEKR